MYFMYFYVFLLISTSFYLLLLSVKLKVNVMSKQQAQCTIYVGGLDNEITSTILHAAFLPFGEIIHISLPIDPSTSYVFIINPYTKYKL